ncbi:hypothetical protein WG66_011901 [Moniliophthora roreri]|nr:hypothetical protein WG66_011901 [Moniliophthora roreri]
MKPATSRRRKNDIFTRSPTPQKHLAQSGLMCRLRCIIFSVKPCTPIFPGYGSEYAIISLPPKILQVPPVRQSTLSLPFRAKSTCITPSFFRQCFPIVFPNDDCPNHGERLRFERNSTCITPFLTVLPHCLDSPPTTTGSIIRCQRHWYVSMVRPQFLMIILPTEPCVIHGEITSGREELNPPSLMPSNDDRPSTSSLDSSTLIVYIPESQ